MTTTTTTAAPFDGDALLKGLADHGCAVAGELFALAPIEGMGVGLLAAAPIPAGTPLFSIPPSYILSEYTSALRLQLSAADWDALAGGWTRLILALMWEDSRADSPWRAYLDNMPRSFRTPMWWPEADLPLLRGTDIEGRIGRESANADYEQRVAPLLAKYPQVFAGDFSLEQYHVQGSRVLSRSFTVPISRADPAYVRPEEEDEEEEEEEDEEGVAVMVPLADMLNAAYEMDNARLFSPDEDPDSDDEEGEEAKGDVSMHSAKSATKQEAYTMTTTKDIAAGEQIYNTYSSPCNSELLRKYGHVDALPFGDGFTLPAALAPALGGNAGDECELSGDLVLRAVARALKRPIAFDDEGRPSAPFAERLEAWLDENDDAFALALDGELPDELVSFARLFLEEGEWERARTKGKMPKPAPTAEVLSVLEDATSARLARYAEPGLEGDVAAIKAEAPGSNARNAAVVRLGEKRCLLLAQQRIAELKKELKKRKIEERKAGRESKRRR